MHSRIFQFAQTPILEKDYINEEDYFDHWFVGSVADYVANMEATQDPQEDIDWLMTYLKPFGAVYNKEMNTIVFPDDFKYKYFEKRLETLKEKVSALTLEAFTSPLDIDTYCIERTINYRYGGFQIHTDDWEHLSLDEFVRHLPLEKTTYYIGAILDFHC